MSTPPLSTPGAAKKAPATAAPGAAKKATAAPRRPSGTTTTGAAPTDATPARTRSLEQHIAVLSEGEVLDPQGLYEYCEALRALSTGLAFFVHAAASQLDRAVRKGAKDSADGRLTLAQKAKLTLTLRRVSRQLDSGAAESLLASATSAVKAYALMEDFLEELESSYVDRPHRSNRGGFTLNRSI